MASCLTGFGQSAHSENESIHLVLRLNGCLSKLDREARFEDPIEILLQADHLGEVVDGRTCQQTETCEIELMAANGHPTTLMAIVRLLEEEILVPRGSYLIIEGDFEGDDQHIAIGMADPMMTSKKCDDLHSAYERLSKTGRRIAIR